MAKAMRRRALSNYAHVSAADDGVIESYHRSLLSILDLAGGTGDVAFRFVDAANCEERAKLSGKEGVLVTVYDIN